MKSRKCLYLHGFASGPSSTKAKYFDDKLKMQNFDVRIPDLNEPGFEKLTISSQLKIVEAEMANEKAPVVIVGSSMGGLLATLESMRNQKVRALILMAPGFGLMNRWPALFGKNTLADWKEKGSLEIFHHGYGKDLPLDYGFIEDASNYKTDSLVVDVPTLVFHGRNDETVPISESELFQANNPNMVELHRLDDDHQLIESLPFIWEQSEKFLDRVI